MIWPDTLMRQISDHCGSWVRYLLAAHVRKVCDFFLARHLRIYSRISRFLPLLNKKKKEKRNPLEHLGSYAAWYFPNAKLGTCCELAWLLRWKRAWSSMTNPCAYTTAISESQRWGLTMMDVWEDCHGTALYH